jgi:predicted dehydrogenase
MWGEWNRDLFSVEDFAAGFIHFAPTPAPGGVKGGREGKGGNLGATMTLETAWLGHQVENEDMSCQLFGKVGGLKWPTGEFASVQGGVFAQGSLTFPVNVEKPHYAELEAFRDCVVNDTESPVPWRETEKVIAILEAIYLSQREGREVYLDAAG